MEFKATPKLIGNSYHVLIPKKYIDDGIVKLDTENTFYITSGDLTKQTDQAVVAEITQNIIKNISKRVNGGNRISYSDQ